MSVALGKPTRYTYLYLVDGAPADAVTALTITLPDGSTRTPTVLSDVLGTFYADDISDQLGDWAWTWTAHVDGILVDSDSGTFEVLQVSGDVGLIRLLINDLSIPQSFRDTDLEQIYELEGAVKLAAAQLLDMIASNEALVSKRIRTLDLQTDGPAVAKALREHATALRAQHTASVDVDGDDDGFAFTTELGLSRPRSESLEPPMWS